MRQLHTEANLAVAKLVLLQFSQRGFRKLQAAWTVHDVNTPRHHVYDGVGRTTQSEACGNGSRVGFEGNSAAMSPAAAASSPPAPAPAPAPLTGPSAPTAAATSPLPLVAAPAAAAAAAAAFSRFLAFMTRLCCTL